MELVTGLFAAGVGGGAATAATATGAAAIAGGGGSFLSMASALGTAFTAISTIGSGVAAANEAKAAAKQADFKAKDERIRGEMERADIKKNLALTLQRNQVAMAAGGVDFGSVSSKQVQQQVQLDAERELGMSWINTMRSSLLQANEARRLRSKASNLLFTSLSTAAAGIGGGIAEASYRG